MKQQSTSVFGVALESVVNAYRLGMEGQASDQLTKLIDMIGALLPAAPRELVLKIHPFLAEALAAIERKDYLWVADLLEYEIAPLMLPLSAPTVLSTTNDQQNTSSDTTMSPQFSNKGRKLISMYATMAKEGYERVDHSKVQDAFNDFELKSYRENIRAIFQQQDIKTALDYGCGGADWRACGFDPASGQSAIDYFHLEQAYRYEPARDLDERRLVDCVISFDVLEHIFIADVPVVLRDMFSYARKLLLLNVACYPAAAKLPNGENAHVTVRDPLWWKGMLDCISVDYPCVGVYLMCSTGWCDSTAYPLWSAEMWQQEATFVINF
ncbi:MAG: hypothetical protein JXR59_01790 [Desulfuromonadaceae bacterium]|nr:hypothetical protein [Desulfuromonadaceae bacterium]